MGWGGVGGFGGESRRTVTAMNMEADLSNISEIDL